MAEPTVREILEEQMGVEPQEEIEISEPDVVESVEQKAERVRDEAGRFAKTEEKQEKPEKAVSAVKQPVEQAATEAPVELSPLQRPSSWKKEAQAKFATLDPEIQAEVMRRENDMHKGIEGYKQSAERATLYDRTFAPYAETMRKIGTTPEQAISGLMQTDHNLRYGSPAQKVAIVHDIIKQYGIKPEWFDQQETQVNPEVGHLQTRLQAMEAQQAAWQQEVQAREVGTLNSDIQSFAKNNEHFEAVRDRMADLIQGGAAKTLQEAYDTAVWSDPNVRGALLAKQQAEERAKATAKATEAKKASSVNIRARGTIPAQAPLGSIEDTIRARAKELGMY